MKEISSYSRLHRILPLAYQILGNVIDHDKFNKYGSEYLHEDCKNLSVEISFMLSQTQSLLSK